MSTDPAPPFAVQSRTTRVRRSKGDDRVVTADRESNATEQRAASPAPRLNGVSTPFEEPQRTFAAADDGLVHPDGSVDLDLLLESLHRERLTPNRFRDERAAPHYAIAAHSPHR